MCGSPMAGYQRADTAHQAKYAEHANVRSSQTSEKEEGHAYQEHMEEELDYSVLVVEKDLQHCGRKK